MLGSVGPLLVVLVLVLVLSLVLVGVAPPPPAAAAAADAACQAGCHVRIADTATATTTTTTTATATATITATATASTATSSTMAVPDPPPLPPHALVQCPQTAHVLGTGTRPGPGSGVRSSRRDVRSRAEHAGVCPPGGRPGLRGSGLVELACVRQHPLTGGEGEDDAALVGVQGHLQEGRDHAQPGRLVLAQTLVGDY
jgi:hypothetical protein